MRRRLLPLFIALTLAAIPGHAAALGTLDQEAANANLGGGCIPDYKAQTFTVGLTGLLDTVEVFSYPGSNYGPLWNIEIRSVTGGAPSATILATGSAPWPGVASWTQIALSPAIAVQSGETYAIVSTTTPCWGQAIPYAGGTFFYSNDHVSWNDAGADLAFRTYVTQAAAPTPPRITFTVSHLVSATSAGTYTSSLSVSAGSEAWHRIEVKNTGETGLNGLTVSGAGGTLPAGCPAIPAPFAIGATYTCTYHATVPAGTTTDTVTAAFGALSSTALVTLTGTGVRAVSIGSRLGLPGAAGAYSATTKVTTIQRYVTWRANLGPGAAGARIGVWVATKGPDGTWSSFTRVTGRTADSAGVVTFSWRAPVAAWQSVRFTGPGTSTTASQARWR
jgi:hypothetical protein